MCRSPVFTSLYQHFEGFEGSEIRRRQEVFAASRSYFEIMFDAVAQIESKVGARVLIYGATPTTVDHESLTSAVCMYYISDNLHTYRR